MTLLRSGSPKVAWPLKAGWSVALLATLFAGVYGCGSSNKKEMGVMLRQIKSIDERTNFLYKNVKVQADISANLEQLHATITALTGQIEELNARSQMLSDRMDKLGSGLPSQKQVIENTRAANIRLERINDRLKTLSAETLAFIKLMERRSKISKRSHRQAVEEMLGGGESGAVAAKDARSRKTVPQKPAESPEELYQRSYNAYLRGDYDVSIKGFAEYLKRYPQTALSDNAAYWIGESYYGKAYYGDALRAFDEMVENYPKSNKAPAALLKSAYAMIKLNNEQAAKERFGRIVEQYPTSNEAILASERLESKKSGSSPGDGGRQEVGKE